MARNYRCSDIAYIQGLLDLAGERTPGRWETFREVLAAPLLDIAELEHHATGLQSANTSHIPGLLQTTDHAREIFRQVVPEFSRSDIEHRVSHRLQRQAILDRTASPPYQAVIHEAALRVPVGCTTVAKAQLRHLLEQSEREHITIQVIPFAIGAYPGSGQTIRTYTDRHPDSTPSPWTSRTAPPWWTPRRSWRLTASSWPAWRRSR